MDGRTNTADPVFRHAEAAPDSVALRGAAAVWRYATLRDRVRSVAGRLSAAGVRPGDRVLLIAPSVPEFAAAYYGIHTAGAIAVTANTMAPAPELAYVARDAGVRLVLGWHAVTPAPETAAAELGVPYWPLTEDLTDFPLDEATAPERPHPTAAEDTAALLYTSGTTGRPKGAQLTHGNFTAAARLFCQVHEIGAEDRAATALPLFHVYGLSCLLGTTMHVGASLTLLERFDPAELLAAIRRDRPTFIAGVPTMWNALLHQAGADARPADFAELRHASSGGASLPVEVLRAFEQRFGCAVLEGYGLTESTGAATYQAAEWRTPGRVGRALPGCEVIVRGEDGSLLPPGAVGEVLLRGPVVMKGYWNRPEATAETLTPDGWLRTGDLGALDEQGSLRIVDRKKDLVIRGGYNVYPREVEEVLYQHPDIVEAAVLGVPHPHYGEEVAAVIALRPGSTLDADTLRSWAKQQLSAYKVPHLVAVVDELPKGATGKILKRAIDRSILTGDQQ